MRFKSGKEFRDWPSKAVTLFGMSGVGKTTLAGLLQKRGWFQYSVDYRIGTRYMGEHIVDNFKREAMRVPFLRDLLQVGFNLYLLQHHLRESEPALHLSWQARQSGQGRHLLCRIQAPPEPAPRSGNPRPARRAGVHRAGPRYLSVHALCLRFRRQPVRSCQSRRSRRSGAQLPVRTHPAALHRRQRRSTPRCWSSASARIPSPCTTSRLFSTPNGPNTRS